MSMSRLASAVFLAIYCAAAPSQVRAEDEGDFEEERIEVRKRVRPDDGGMRDRERGEKRRGRRFRNAEMEESFEKISELQDKVNDLARSAREGSDTEKAAAKIELKKALGELYDARLASEVRMLEQMEKNTAELRARVAKKKASRERAIETRLARMTGEGDDW